MGLPIDVEQQAGFVTVYALRTTLIAALAVVLAATKHFRLLGIIALIALILPIGDAWLTAQAGASDTIVFRHVGIAIFLAFTGVMLLRDGRRGLEQ